MTTLHKIAWWLLPVIVGVFTGCAGVTAPSKDPPPWCWGSDMDPAQWAGDDLAGCMIGQNNDMSPTD